MFLELTQAWENTGPGNHRKDRCLTKVSQDEMEGKKGATMNISSASTSFFL